MKRSQNEILAMATKAARGAGHPTGLAEEMANAALWLCQNASTACLAICGMDGLAAGISRQAILTDVRNPLMLLGICATASVEMQTGVELDEWAKVDQGGVISIGDEPPIGDYALRLYESSKAVANTANGDQLDIPDHRWSVLEALAARTYVPASTESRASGAGAGLTDND